MNVRLRVYLLSAMIFAAVSVFVGFSVSVVGPYTIAEAHEEVIRGAETPRDVRSRIAEYESGLMLNRFLLLCAPSLAALVSTGLALVELHFGRQITSK